MNSTLSLLALLATVSLGFQLNAQTAETPATVTTQRISLIKVEPGKGQEWLNLTRETTMKVAQVEADAGDIISWTLLESVYPVGSEARADYMISVIFAGNPKASGANAEDVWKKAGITMTRQERNTKRNSVSHLVAAELWRPIVYNGTPKKGDYLTVNHMQVIDNAKYDDLERNIWSPLSKEWIREGAMTGWLYARKMLPAGSETKYTAMTADMYPSLEAVFANRNFNETFAKVHPSRKVEDLNDLSKIRNMGRRELWRIVERVTKKG